MLPLPRKRKMREEEGRAYMYQNGIEIGPTSLGFDLEAPICPQNHMSREDQPGHLLNLVDVKLGPRLRTKRRKSKIFKRSGSVAVTQ
jgi:hypothetical protein